MERASCFVSSEMCTSRASRSSCGAALLLLVVAVVVDFASAEEPDSKTPWKTLNGEVLC